MRAAGTMVEVGTGTRQAAGVLALPELCVGCGLCEIACGIASLAGAARNGRGEVEGRRLLLAWEQARRLSRITVYRGTTTRHGNPSPSHHGNTSPYFPWTCRHCERPPCVGACVSGAMTRDPSSGLVYVRQDLCVGCGTCVVSCPLGAVGVHPIAGIAWKCDGCRSLESRPCVSVCPTGALRGIRDGAGIARRARRERAACLAPRPREPCRTRRGQTAGPGGGTGGERAFRP